MDRITLYEELNELIDYVEEHLLDITSLDQCLDRTFLSKYHVIHVFRQVTGFTLMDYVQSRKMAMSLSDLSETDLRIIDLAVKYGFGHEQSFIRAFKRYYGMTPAKYRKNPRGSGCSASSQNQRLFSSSGWLDSISQICSFTPDDSYWSEALYPRR